MLQKIVNGIAIASGVVSITVVGIAGYVYIRKDAIIDNVKGKIIESALPKGLGEALTGGGMPTLPTTQQMHYTNHPTIRQRPHDYNNT